MSRPPDLVDRPAFEALVEQHRRELQVHCYRMLGSFEDAEDLVQETFLRAWRRRDTFEGRSQVRTWLYRIATNACLDTLASRARRILPSDILPPADPTLIPGPPPDDVPWLQPYPDRLLPSGDAPDAEVVARETIELAFIAAVQHLPPRQRAALILRDVLGWSASESATLLELSVAALNSALQRARSSLRKHLPARRLDWSADPTEVERSVVQRYMTAMEHADATAFANLLRADARMLMPPLAAWFDGRDAVVTASMLGLSTMAERDFRMVVTGANRQPAVAGYYREPGAAQHRGLVLNVLRVEAGQLVDIVGFGPEIFPAFDLPLSL